jgi:hypothetical protein
MFFIIVGNRGRGFFPLWDTTEVFFRCGIQQRRFSFVVGYNRRGFFPLWDTMENNLRVANKFFSMYSTTQEIFLPLYPTPQQNILQCTVSWKNLQHCIPQRRRFSSIVSHNGRYFIITQEVFFVMRYNGRSFPPLWDTTEEVFFYCGIQQKRFFSIVGYNGKKIYNLE